MAERTSLSAARLSRVENGTSLLSLPEIDEWASAVGADTDARARLHHLAEAAHTPAVEAFRHGGPDLQRSVLDLEARAGHVLTAQPTIVPALLQTVAYARAVLDLADVTSQDIAAAVALRLRRQELLHDPSKRFGFILTEAALRWPAGDAHVMAAQYDRIAQISTLPNVTVGVIPLGRQVLALPWCDINLYEGCGDGEPPIIDIELPHGEVWIVDPVDVEVYKTLIGKPYLPVQSYLAEAGMPSLATWRPPASTPAGASGTCRRGAGAARRRRSWPCSRSKDPRGRGGTTARSVPGPSSWPEDSAHR